MLRLPLLPELPMSRLAIWSWRFALFALMVAVLSIVVVRTGLLEVLPALATFGAALVFALLAVLSAFLAFVVIWRQGLLGLGRAVGGLLLGLLLLAYPGYLGYRAYKLPVINDITTDPAHPPAFGKLANLRRPGTDSYPAKFAALQEQAYPDIEPLEFDASPRVAYSAAAEADRKAQVAGGRRDAAHRQPRRRDRSRGAHDDHGLSRRRGDPGERGRRRLARRRAFGLALRPRRFRHQRAARDWRCSTTSKAR